MRTEDAIARAIANYGKEMRVFDWDKAARLIIDRRPAVARAGLDEDYANTGGSIYALGNIVTTSYTYLASNWDIPTLYLDYTDGSSEKIPCYKMESEVPRWNESTKWPSSARKILAEKNE